MSSTQPGTSFRDRDHNGITTVLDLQYAMTKAGLDPFDHVVWDEQRRIASTSGIYVVTPLDDGTFTLDVRDRGSIKERGVFATEADVVRAYLADANPTPPPDQARVRAAARRDYVDNMAERERMKEEDRQMVARVMRERAEAGLPLDPTAE